YPSWYIDRDWNRFPSLYTLYALHQHAIQYAMIYKPFLNGDQIDDVHNRIAQFPDQLKYVNTFDEVEVYQLIAPPPSDPPALRFEFDEFVPGDGWYSPERNETGATFAWMQTPQATLDLPPLTPTKPRVFRAQIYSYADQSLLNALQVTMNGQPIILNAQQTDSGLVLQGNIPQAAFAGDTLQIVLETLSYGSPVQRGTGNDARNLGIAFDWIEISAAN
ncbi:MAG TPA: hypothetical protein VG897_13780, partial [Terriglobales bacterium]|nr:hypothetical protein [Terriglobales bacterium]